MAKLTILAKMERNGQKSQNGHAKNSLCTFCTICTIEGKVSKVSKVPCKICMRIVRNLRILTFLSVFFQKRESTPRDHEMRRPRNVSCTPLCQLSACHLLRHINNEYDE